MSAAAKPDLSGPLDNSDGKFQSSRALTREYDSWIKRFQAFSGPTCIAKARRALPGAFFTQMVVPMALAMQCKRDKDLREQGTRLLIEPADAELLKQASEKGDHVADQVIRALGTIDAMHAGGPAPDLTSVLVQRF